jgi:hypothetical protein
MERTVISLFINIIFFTLLIAFFLLIKENETLVFISSSLLFVTFFFINFVSSAKQNKLLKFTLIENLIYHFWQSKWNRAYMFLLGMFFATLLTFLGKHSIYH